MIITGKDNIMAYRERVLLSGLKLEAKHGMKVSTGRSCYAIVKDEFNLKGNKIKVYTQFKELLSKKE
tara:strand:- start:950 stop:1150 length:201 start_codon:yes stop_codon:yes gene_type:complete